MCQYLYAICNILAISTIFDGFVVYGADVLLI